MVALFKLHQRITTATDNGEVLASEAGCSKPSSGDEGINTRGCTGGGAWGQSSISRVKVGNETPPKKEKRTACTASASVSGSGQTVIWGNPTRGVSPLVESERVDFESFLCFPLLHQPAPQSRLKRAPNKGEGAVGVHTAEERTCSPTHHAEPGSMYGSNETEQRTPAPSRHVYHGCPTCAVPVVGLRVDVSTTSLPLPAFWNQIS